MAASSVGVSSATSVAESAVICVRVSADSWVELKAAICVAESWLSAVLVMPLIWVVLRALNMVDVRALITSEFR